jgi:hypothetical protein
VFAQVLAAGSAIRAAAASGAKPGDANPVADLQAIDACIRLHDRADDLMPRDNRVFDIGKLVVEDVQIGPTHAAGLHPESNLERPQRPQGHFPGLESGSSALEDLS